MENNKIILIVLPFFLIIGTLFIVQVNNYNQNLEKDLVKINSFYSINNDSYSEDLSFDYDYYQKDPYNKNIFNSSIISYKSLRVNFGKTETSLILEFHTLRKVKDKWLYLYINNYYSYYFFGIDEIKSIKIKNKEGKEKTYDKEDLVDKWFTNGNLKLDHEMFNSEFDEYTIEILMEPMPIKTNEIIIQNCIRDINYYFGWNADEFVYISSNVGRTNNNVIYYSPTNISPMNTKIETTIIRDKTKNDWNLYIQFLANALAFSVVIVSAGKYLLGKK
ncbi:MAG: hypothetical protein HPY60_05325 [Candidatus Methanofastidiosum sp.]|nr:hypothetical protein [Methanofastidiosum sp.]